MRNRRSGEGEDEDEPPANALNAVDDFGDAGSPHGIRKQRRARQGGDDRDEMLAAHG